MPFNLKTKLSEVKGIGAAKQKILKKLGIQTIEDLIYYFPRTFENRGNILSISQLKKIGKGCIKSHVKLIHQRRSYKKRIFLTEAIVSDGKDSLKVIWFNQPFLKKALENKQVYLSGQINSDPSYGIALINPVWEIVKKTPPIHTQGLVPIYPLTEGISQKQIRSLIWLTLSKIPSLKDWLPEEIKKQYGLIDLKKALSQIHFPKNVKELEQAKQRLKFDELFLLALSNKIIKKKIKEKSAPIIKFQEQITKNFVQSLKFNLTSSQKRESWKILKEMEKGKPMNRLIIGDVGSGKTIVALIAALNCLANGYQVVYMAPTEILAQQFFDRAKQYLKKVTKKNICLLSKNNYLFNNKKIKTKRTLVNYIKQGKADLIVGTHSLISQKNPLTFKNLGLIIIDEQHRFGVEQRAKLVTKEKKNFLPHFLSLSATPIPRTLALTLYGDIDISYISELPAGRKAVITKAFKEDEKEKAFELIAQRLKNKELVFIVCPLINPSSKLEIRSVKEEYENIKKRFSKYKVAILHGKVKSEEKIKTIENFKRGKINILVTTSLIEVGIDIPKATTMLVENAERFGLAQLYQLRGRIGRNKKQAYCFLFYKNVGNAEQRIQAFLKAKTGIEIAEKDLLLRGPGELFGYAQSGKSVKFKLIDFKETELIEQTRKIANLFLKKHQDIKKFPLLWNKIKEYLK